MQRRRSRTGATDGPTERRLPTMQSVAALLSVSRLVLVRGGTLVFGAMLLSACGKEADPAATQIAAKVGKGEISVHQINFVLQRQTQLRPEQVEAAGKEVLERLIDQELALQKAIEQQLDRDPTIVQSLEAARREILARAYVDRVGAATSAPTDAEIQAYYDAHPALFGQRRVYTFVEHLVGVNQEQANAIQRQMAEAKSSQQVIEWIRKQGFPLRDARNTTPAEALPLTLLDRFAAMKVGQAMVIPGTGSIRFIVLENAVSEPKSLQEAKPVIAQYLGNDSKRKAVESDLKALRLASPIEYTPKFAAKPGEAASEAAAAAAVDDAPAQVTAAAAVPAAAAASGAAAAAISSEALGKGLTGLK
jgi:EpsD family peptidyl-prolyl cis-trans isomerase